MPVNRAISVHDQLVQATRTKDLIDIVLLIRGENIDKVKTASALRVTFAKRATHRMPHELSTPPAPWEPVFEALSKECGLAMNLEEGFEIVREFTRMLEM